MWRQVVRQLAGQNIRAIKRIDPNQMKLFDSMKSYCITLGTSNVATISKSVSARYYLPYAHWWGELGHRANGSDLLPAFRTGPSMIPDEGKANKHVGEQAYRSSDHPGTEATGRRTQGGGRGPGSRRVETHDLRLEGEVRRDGCESGAGSQAVAG